MKKLCFFFAFLASTSAFAQWTQMKTPGSGYSALSVFDAGSYEFLLTGHGLYQLNDQKAGLEEVYDPWIAGVSIWNDTLVLFPKYQDKVQMIDLTSGHFNALSTDIYFWNFSSSLVTDSVIYFGSNPGGVTKITNLNDRKTKIEIDDGLIDMGFGYEVLSLAIKNDTLYTATRTHIFWCVIGEYHWTPLEIQFPSKRIAFIKVYKDNLYVGVKDESNREGHPYPTSFIYQSKDQGASFHEFSPESLGRVTNMTFLDSLYIFSTLIGGIYASTDEGVSWKQQNSGLKDRQISFVEHIKGQLYCGSANSGAYYMEDTVWKPIQLKNPQFRTQNVVSEGDQLYINTVDSVYKINTEHKWENITPPNASDRMWTQMVKKSDQLVVSGYKHSNYRIWNDWDLFLMADNGEWSQRNTPFNGNIEPDSRLLKYDGHRIYVSNGTTYYSDTQALTWAYGANEIKPYYMEIVDHKVFLAKYDIMVLFSTNPRVFSWINLKDILNSAGLEMTSSDEISYFCSCQNNLFIKLRHWDPEKRHGFLRSSDFGESWELANNGLESLIKDNYLIRSHTCKDSTLAIITDSRVLVSHDLGDSWQIIQNPEGNYYGSAAIRNDSLYMSTLALRFGKNQGIWIHPLNKSLNSPDIKLDSFNPLIYPNPAKDYFQVKLSNVNKPVILKIYSLTGKLLVSKESYQGDKVNLQPFTSGIYLTQIISGEINKIQKIIIQR